jgi:hypothetical protein
MTHDQNNHPSLKLSHLPSHPTFMLRWLRYVFPFAIIVLVALSEANAQRIDTNLSGIVYDSLTRLPMPYVTVINQTKNNGVTTDDNGAFAIKASPGDSIMFTILGYSRKHRVVGSNAFAMIVFLREFALTLKPVTIYGSFSPSGSEQWTSVIEMPRVFKNPAGPGSGYVVETFGPGVSLGGLLSKFSKSEKEKRKVATVREKAKQSETYLSVIVSDETKNFFQQTFNMSETEYDKFVASFNQAHPEAVYIESKDEIMKLMVVFKATKG